jgi:hypothetical protein
MPIVEYEGKYYEAEETGDGYKLGNEVSNPNAKAEPSRPGQTFLQSFGDAATLGYLPNLQAASEKVTFPILNALTGEDIQADDYVTAHDSYRKRQNELQEENPVASAAGTVTGVGSSLLIPGGQAKGLSTGAKLLRSGAIGAGYGAAMNPGDVEGETGLQISDRAKNAAIGGVTGVAGEGLLQGANKLISKAPKESSRRFYKGLGPYQRDVLKLKPGQMESVGNTAKEAGLFKGLPSHEMIGHRAAQAADEAGQQLDQLINHIDDQITKAVGKSGGDTPAIPGKGGEVVNFGVDRGAIVDDALDRLLVEDGIPGAAAKNQKVVDLLGEFLQGKGKMLSLRESENLKRAIGKQIKWDRLPGADIPVDEEVLRALYSALRKGGEDAAEFAADTLGGGLKEQLIAAKTKYADLDHAASVAGTRASREFANRIVSPSDYGSGAAAALMTGNPAAAVAGALANKGMREHGNVLTGKALTQIGKLSGKPQGKQRSGMIGARALGQQESEPIQGGGLGSQPVGLGLTLERLLGTVPAAR